MHTYKYPRPEVAVDAVVFGFDAGALKLVLIQRGNEPAKGQWALPGALVRETETADETVRRSLAQKTGLTELFLEQLYTFSDTHRDPRGRVISIAYYCLVKKADYTVQLTQESPRWFNVDDLPALAFDHATIIKTALSRLRAKLIYQPIGFELLPQKFTLSQLQHLYEVVLGRTLDKRNFRKKILSTQILLELPEKETGVKHKAAQFYQFDRVKYEKLSARGLNIEV